MRFRLPHPARVLAALGLTAGSLVSAATVPAAADVIEPFGLRYAASLYGDFTTIGNTVVGCPDAPAGPAARCAAATSGRGPDGEGTFVTRRIDAAGTGSAAFGSSTGHVRIPAGARVAYARLSWGGNDGTYRGPGGAPLMRCAPTGADAGRSPGDPTTTAPVLRVGSGAAVPVSLDSVVADPADTAGPHYYTGESDVTAAFAGVSATDARVAVGNVWAPSGKGCAAGWSLTVVHAFPGPDPVKAPERRDVRIYGGHVLQRPASPATTITVDGFHRAPGTVRAGVTAYGGDRSTPGDRFLVNGRTVLAPRTGDTDNFFSGENDGALSPRLAHNLSVDAKTFDVPAGVVEPGATTADLAFTTGGDPYVPTGLALSVPVPDLEIPRTATPKREGAPPAPTRSATPKPKSVLPAPTRTDPAPTGPAPAREEPEPDPKNPSPKPSTPRGVPAAAPASPEAPVAPSTATSSPQPPAAPAPGPQGARHAGSMAETGSSGERLWLLGALAVALAATGLVAKAAMRGRRN
ncbi:hypothetical protein PUR59_08815 [Streptomyces sp. SP18ES09]|uniref:hypothetical protein n=1 Tax=Streptomyces sp. SP18ES09 TaxID=3002532 RepID=UPI002E76EBB1|nr:hypothetical protein [Streptomyces sp. SP18ES09]MEE1815115.1 hypothetical protein [Streptomyces sp. SP18ES09]